MKHLLRILLLLALAISAPAQTSLKFSDFTPETSPAGTDFVAGFRTSGVAGGNRRFSLSTLNTYFSANVTGLTNTQISGLAWSKLTGTPTTLAGYGITDPVALTSGSYADPSWITSLAWSKLTSTPTTLAGYGITDPVILTSGSYSDPTWLTLSKSKVGLGNVPNVDATLRANHTGSQAISTVSGLQTALDSKEPAITAGSAYQVLTASKSISRRAPTYTAAALLALSASDAAELSFAYSSDCLTPQGTGAPVYFDGSKWRSAVTRIEVTTDMLTFLRSLVVDAGMPLVASKTYAHIEVTHYPTSSYGVQNSGAANREGVDSPGRPSWIAFSLASTTNAGVRNFSDHPLHTNQVTHVYVRRVVFLSALSTSTEEFNYRCGIEGAGAFALQGTFAGFVYDRGNALGALNAANNDRWLCVTRSSSTNTVTVSSVTPSISASTPDVLEMLYTPTNVRFFINGTEVSTGHTTNIPTGTLYRNDCANKSAGTTTRTVRFTEAAHVLRMP